MARAIGLGFLVGFPIAVSPGPIFFLVLRRTLARGWRSGLVSGLGVATGDASYAALAAFGVAAVTAFLIAERRWIGLVGGIAIAVIGLQALGSPHPDPPPQAGEGNSDGGRPHPDPPPQAGEGNSDGGRLHPDPPPQAGEGNSDGGRPHPDPPPQAGREYLSALVLTLSNPSTILSFTAVFAGLGIHVAGGWGPALALVVGVWLGSVVWWILLTGAASRLRERLTPSIIRGFGLASGVALVGFGVIAIGAALRG